MKKFLTLAALLIVVLTVAACSSNPAPLIAPEPDVVSIEDDADTYEHNNDIIQEADSDNYGELYSGLDFDNINPWAEMPIFGSLTGEVVEVNVEYTYPPTYIFRIQGEGGSTNFIADFNTFFLGDMPIVGDTITGFYLMDVFIAAVYPPQFTASVIVNGEFGMIAVDRFDEELKSYDGFLMLNIDDETEIILQDGELFDCELAHRKLVVLYDISTRSIPAITTPNKIIVLFERFTTGPAFL